MSARMRTLASRHSDIEITHRSFALGWEEEDFIRMFGSRKAVKKEVLSHWEQANRNDDAHRFNIEGMASANFDFPLSKAPLIAAKAAGMLGGESAYWDAFDRIQCKLFVENQDIEDFSVLKEAVRETGVDVKSWEEKFYDSETERAVRADIKRAAEYGVHSVPTLVIDGTYKVSGALPLDRLEQILEDIRRKSGSNGLWNGMSNI